MTLGECTNLVCAHDGVAGDVGRESAGLRGRERPGEEGDGRGDLVPPRDDPVEPRRVGVAAARLVGADGLALPPRDLLLQLGDSDLKRYGQSGTLGSRIITIAAGKHYGRTMCHYIYQTCLSAIIGYMGVI